jgi:two-component system, chemotaxis family, CheB/CheR fusion protein
MADEGTFSQLVVVGSSAGGIEALSRLVAKLPGDLRAPLVIAQHLDPSRLSHLGDILGRHSTLPVRTVADREQLRPGTVYVVPANRHVEISDHDLRLLVRSEGVQEGAIHSKPSIDLLLSSAAHLFGEGTIAIILTGTGSDGAAGAIEVKKAGGTVIIQDPRTASYPALPLSLPPTIVDVIAGLDEIGPILRELLAGEYTPKDMHEETALRNLLRQLEVRHGIDFQSYKRPTILRRLQRRMAATGNSTMLDYIRYSEAHPDEYHHLISSFLIKVTEFFRDTETFSYLQARVLPELIEEARHRDKQLRIWSAGCATGEEAYSLAILVTEALGDELDQFNVRIFGTDLDNDAIEFARRGRYPASALDNLPRELVAKHFTESQGEYQISKQVRGLIIFGQHDLAERAPFPRTDLIMCRNVLIYFSPELQRHVLQLFAFSLRDAGYLGLGKAETSGPLSAMFVPDEPSLKIFRRRGDRILTAPGRINESMRVLARRSLPSRYGSGRLESTALRREQQRAHPPLERSDNMLLQLPIGVVVVDRRYDIQTINNVARRVLGIHGSAIGEDFIHLAQTLPSRQLRTAIDKAFRGEAAVTLDEIDIAQTPAEEAHCIRIDCQLERGEGSESTGDSVVVLVNDLTDIVQRSRTIEEVSRSRGEEIERLREQLQALVVSNRELHEANQELATANMALRSANEEFLVGNEELQAATEEVETLNEELQATNEELETLNEELQATVEELNTTNDDLQARSTELQELAVTLEHQRETSDTQRAHLATILVSMADAVLVVDESGSHILSNRAYVDMFGDPDTEFVSEDEGGRPLPDEATPQRRAARGESFSMQFTSSDQDGTRRWFEANGQPIRQDGQKAGVLVIRDITERSIRRLQDEFLALASHELRTPLTVLKGSLSMIRRQAPEGAEQSVQRYTGLALDQAARLEALVRDLTDVTRLQTGRLSLSPEVVDLAPLVAQAVEGARNLADEQHIHLETRSKGLQVNADPMRLDQVLSNLLTNAIVHAPDSGRIDVRLRRVRRKAEIQVQDYGPGIPAADLPILFTRFHTVAQQGDGTRTGLGLGLFIARELVRAHDGDIDVSSVEGKGTTVTIHLPLAQTK